MKSRRSPAFVSIGAVLVAAAALAFVALRGPGGLSTPQERMLAVARTLR